MSSFKEASHHQLSLRDKFSNLGFILGAITWVSYEEERMQIKGILKRGFFENGTDKVRLNFVGDIEVDAVIEHESNILH